MSQAVSEKRLSSPYTAVKEFVAGSLAGFVGKLVEHPLDTVKVRLQAQQNGTHATLSFNGPLDCVKSTWKYEGIRGFYRGMSLPLFGTMLETASLFSINASVRSMLTDHTRTSDMSLGTIYLAGGITGGSVAFILTPIEMVKSRLQIQTSAGALFKGPLDCIAKSIHKEGLGVMYRGYSATLLREIPGTAAWFTVYEIVVRWLEPPAAAGHTQDGVETRNSPSPLTAVVGGALSGAAYWLAFYPADTVKSALQTTTSPTRSHRMWTMLSTIYRSHGIRGLYAGVTPTILRAAPANAAVFASYEWLSSHLHRY